MPRVWPPSTTMACPMVKPAPSEHSHSTAEAISSGLAHAADRFLRDDALTSFSVATGKAVHHGGFDDPRADGVDTDIVRRVVQCRGLGQSNHCVFRGGVGSLSCYANHPRAGGRIDDRAAAVGQHQWYFMFEAQEDAFQIDIDALG